MNETFLSREARRTGREQFTGERIVMQKHGKTVAVRVPPSDLEALEALEDRLDLLDALDALADYRANGGIDLEAQFTGERIVMQKHGKTVAVLVPPSDLESDSRRARSRFAQAIGAGRRICLDIEDHHVTDHDLRRVKLGVGSPMRSSILTVPPRFFNSDLSDALADYRANGGIDLEALKKDLGLMR